MDELEALKASFAAKLQEVNVLVADLSTLRDDLAQRAAPPELNGLERRLSDVEVLVSQMTPAAPPPASSLPDDAEARIATLEQKLSDQGETLTGLRTAVESDREKCATLEQKLSDQGETLTGLRALSNREQEKTAALEQKLSDQEEHLGSLNRTVSDGQVQITALERRLAGQAGEISTLDRLTRDGQAQLTREISGVNALVLEVRNATR